MPDKQPNILKSVTKSGDFVEQRKTARLDIPIKVEYTILSAASGRRPAAKSAVTKNISAGGCLLLVAEDLTEGAELELDIMLGEEELEALKLKGKILRINRKEEGLYEYGISFQEISKEARRLFADFCFARMYEMIGLSEWPTDKARIATDKK